MQSINRNSGKKRSTFPTSLKNFKGLKSLKELGRKYGGRGGKKNELATELLRNIFESVMFEAKQSARK